MPQDLAYLALLFALFIVPKALQRYRLPGAVTAFVLGIAAGHAELFGQDPAVALLSTLGIVALFLFAGLDVDFTELRRATAVLLQHLGVQVVLIAGIAVGVAWWFGLEPRAATILALALLTPSTGFILESLGSYGLDDSERYWTRTKAIGAELLALGAMFATVQSTSPVRITVATAALVALVLVVPFAFRMFARFIAPYAPNSEFAFLVLMAAVCAYATRRLGVYYLVGAFIVGVAARRFRRDVPSLASDRMILAVEAFASFFVPFYFFAAGRKLPPSAFSLEALLTGALLLAIMLPVRVLWVAAHRRVALGTSWRSGFRVGVALTPSLVFALILATILHDLFAIPEALWGAVVVYALGTTILPSLVLRAPVPRFEEPKLDAGAAAS